MPSLLPLTDFLALSFIMNIIRIMQKRNPSKRIEVKTLNTRVTPVQHKLMRPIYERILRGIHYRHEFARRHPDITKKCLNLFDHLGLKPEWASSYSAQGGKTVTKVIAEAYRQSKRTSKGRKSKKMLRDFFISYGVIPIAPSGYPFFGDRLRLDVKAGLPLYQVTESDHQWLKDTWNELLAFEVFALAEFSLPRPIMMPALMLPIAKTRSAIVKTSKLIVPSNSSFGMYVNPNQTDAVLDDYIRAILEQAREGDTQHGHHANAYSNIRLDPLIYERYLDALDVKLACGKVVKRSAKEEFYIRCRNNSSKTANIDEYFKACLDSARKYRDNWMLIL